MICNSIETGLVTYTCPTVKAQLCSRASEANLCWPFTSLVLLAPFVWLFSECGALPLVPLSEPQTLQLSH